VWPWDHAAVAYLLVSALYRLGWDRVPSRRAGIVAVVTGVLPDLIDKPLSWGLGVLPTGRSLGHSLLVAVPSLALLVALGIAFGYRRGTVAFGVAYLSHLAGDVAYPFFVDGDLRAGFLLWPLIPAPSSDAGAGVSHVAELVADFLVVLASPGGLLYLGVDALLLGTAAAVWWFDWRAGAEGSADGAGLANDE
jgi:hypothetical protein